MAWPWVPNVNDAQHKQPRAWNSGIRRLEESDIKQAAPEAPALSGSSSSCPPSRMDRTASLLASLSTAPSG